jgi:hypothetical protein
VSVLLEQLLFRTAADGAPAFSLSEGLSVQEALLWRGLSSIEPGEAQVAYGLFSGPNGAFAFVCASRQPDGSPLWKFVLLPRDVLTALAGDLGPLRAIAGANAVPGEFPAQLDRAELVDPAPWPLADRLDAVQALIAARPGGIADLWSLLGMALHERGLILYHAPPEGAARLRLMQALAALLPPSARALLTFTTNRAMDMPSNVRVAFAGTSVATGRWAADWEAAAPLPDAAQTAPYVQFLQSVWEDDLAALLQTIDALDRVSRPFADGRPLDALLAAAVERAALDRRVARGEPVAPEDLRQALRDLPPEGELALQYYARLFDHALEARDNDSAVLIAQAMDDDPALDSALAGRFAQALIDQPDAAYAFIRARVANGEPAGERWLERLALAAGAALSIALADGDADIVRNWIRLLAREPLGYGLTPVLEHGLIDAIPLGRAEPDLARSMLIVAVKRSPPTLDALLADPQFVEALPADLRRLLCDGEADDYAAASAFGVELLLAGLARAAEQHQRGVFSAQTIDTVWAIAFGSQAAQVAEPYSAAHTVQQLLADPAWLPSDAIVALLAATLRGRQDGLFQNTVQALSASPQWADASAEWLSRALVNSKRGAGEAVALLGTLVSAGLLSEQASLTAMIRALDASNWALDALPLAAQAGRSAVRGLELDAEALWRLLEIARAARDEAVARDAARRITTGLEAETDDEAFTITFTRLSESIRWSAAISAMVLNWWRGFARTLPVARLARLDKAYDGQSALEGARAVASSLLAFRRMLGKRTLDQFAAEVAGALALLQSMDEAYEQPSRRDDGFDAEVMRMELESRREELDSADARLVANQLSALAQLIGELGDRRTKQALLRRDDADQLLARGEASPHGAVDALKWISGYLGGSHRGAEDG